MALLDDIKLALRVTTGALDSEVGMLVGSALYDMERAGVNPALLAVDSEGNLSNDMVKNAVTTWCKANFGYDNSEAARFESVYDRLLNALLNSAENVAAIANEPASEPTGETTDEPSEEQAEEPVDETDYASKFNGLSPAEVWASLSYRPTKREYQQACDWLGVTYDETATNAQLRALLAEACGVTEGE